MVAERNWARYDRVELNARPILRFPYVDVVDPESNAPWDLGSEDAPAGTVIVHSGEAQSYEVGSQRRQISRDFLSIGSGDDALAFAKRWGPMVIEIEPDWAEQEDAIRYLGWPINPGADQPPGEPPREFTVVPHKDRVSGLLYMSRTIREWRERLLSGPPNDARDLAERLLIDVVKDMELVFGPGTSLVPQLAPNFLLQLVAVQVLEEARAISPVLQCMNYPAPGCPRDVPMRRGERGRRPLYCSPRCAQRAQSRRSYARRVARKEGLA